MMSMQYLPSELKLKAQRTLKAESCSGRGFVSLNLYEIRSLPFFVMIITFKSWNETGPNGHRKRCFAAIDSSSSLAEPDRPSGSGQMSADVYDV